MKNSPENLTTTFNPVTESPFYVTREERLWLSFHGEDLRDGFEGHVSQPVQEPLGALVMQNEAAIR